MVFKKGYKPTEEQNRKRVESRINNGNYKSNLKNKTYEESFGKEKADKWRQKQSLASIGKPKSEEHRKNLSESKKGHHWNKGIIFSEEHKNNIRLSRMGKHFSEETKKKFSEIHKGQIAWNKGLPKEMQPNFGRVFSEEHNRKISESVMNDKKERERRSNNLKIIRKSIKIPIKDTSIEVKIQSFLTQLHIEYYLHKYMNILHGYQADIFIPFQEGINQKTIIECDGDYWHCNPIKYKSPINKMQVEHIEMDKIRTRELQEKRYRVIRLWETDINSMNLNKFQEIIR